jgi:LAS superfamily LD-carboxypeptidase LdcB
MLNQLELTGRVRSHVVQIDQPRCALNPAVLDPFMVLRAAAAQDGFDLVPYSSFRDFDTQLRIWNLKFSGQRPLFDRDGQVLEFAALNDHEVVNAILGWSALPGASRHHWGTDIDVIDRAAVAADYQVKLLPEETCAGGAFYDLHCWMDRNLERFGFFRPYHEYRGGVHPEPWHISYAPLAENLLGALTPDMVAAAIETSDMLGKELVLRRLPEIFRDYVMNVSQRPDCAAEPGVITADSQSTGLR